MVEGFHKTKKRYDRSAFADLPPGIIKRGQYEYDGNEG